MPEVSESGARMRILHVMAGAVEGGAETMMLDGALALAEAGLRQGAVVRGDNPRRVEALRDAGVTVWTASFDRFWRLPTEAVLRKAVQATGPDVIHHWMGRAGEFAAPKWRARNLGWYGGYYKLARFKNCAWHAGVTADIARHIAEAGAPADRVSTLHTFAQIEPADPVDRASLSTPEEAPVVLALARLHRKKGLDVLIEAAAALPGLFVWIAGSGPLEADLRAQAERVGIADRVRFLGWRTDRSALLAACDVVAFPSRYEPFGTVTVEAWAAGKPLVVADAAGPAATVTHEENALLVPRDDAPALRAALQRVLDDGALARTLVENGRKAYEARFTKTAFVRSAMTLYDRIVRHAPAMAA